MGVTAMSEADFPEKVYDAMCEVVKRYTDMPHAATCMECFNIVSDTWFLPTSSLSTLMYAIVIDTVNERIKAGDAPSDELVDKLSREKEYIRLKVNGPVNTFDVDKYHSDVRRVLSA